MISSDGTPLFGRYRFQEFVHGLFRSNRIPTRASTEPVECLVAFESFEENNGAWIFNQERVTRKSRYPDNAGLVFLGNGLLK